jgi:hypothetical protein
MRVTLAPSCREEPGRERHEKLDFVGDCLPISISAYSSSDLKQEGKIQMSGDTDAFVAERDRIKSELAKLEKDNTSLEKERAEIARKSEGATGDTGTLSQLEIETEQMAEAKRKNDRLIKQATKRLMEVEGVIAMQVQSDMI